MKEVFEITLAAEQGTEPNLVDQLRQGVERDKASLKPYQNLMLERTHQPTINGFEIIESGSAGFALMRMLEVTRNGADARAGKKFIWHEGFGPIFTHV